MQFKKYAVCDCDCDARPLNCKFKEGAKARGYKQSVQVWIPYDIQLSKPASVFRLKMVKLHSRHASLYK